MKFSMIILILLCTAFSVSSQPANGFSVAQKELYDQLKAYNFIETEYKGYQNPDTSVVWQKADNLFKELSLKEIVSCFNDSSYTTRYFAFLKLLPQNDSLAFEKLSQCMNDSTQILFWFNNSAGEKKFNQLLAGEYKKFIEVKYRMGGAVTLADRYYLGENTYYFPKFNAALWKQKYNQFTRLCILYGLN